MIKMFFRVPQYILLSLIVLMALFFCVPNASAWYDSNYGYRREVTIESSQVSTTTDAAFVIVASTTQDWLKHTDHGGDVAQADGYDIIWVDDDDETLLNYEYESYTSTTGAITHWIEVADGLSSTTDGTIYMYYGYGSASDNSTSGDTWAQSHAVGVWHLPETPTVDSNALDSTNRGNHGAIDGSMTTGDQIAGQLNGSLDFDGVDDELTMPEGGGLADIIGASDFTAMLWINIATAVSEYPLGQYQDSNNRTYWLVDTDTFLFFSKTGGTEYIYLNTSSAAADSGVWTHLAVTCPRGSTPKVYKNAESKSMSAPNCTAADISNTGQGYIARYGSNVMPGALDEVRIYNTALTQDDITTIYNMESNNASFLTFGDEELGNSAPSASTVSHDSGEQAEAGFDITFTGAWTESDAGDLDKMYVCKSSDCSNCDNTAQTNCWCYSSAFQTEPDVTDTCAYQAQISDAGSQSYWLGVCDDAPACDATPLSGGSFFITTTSTAEFTMSFWLRPTNSVTSTALAVKENEMRIVTDSSSIPACLIHNGTDWQTAATATDALVLNQWSYLACAYDRTNIKMYTNGVLQATQSMSVVDLYNATTTLDIGHDAGGDYNDFQGYIDEFKYYKYGRSAVQIQADYAGEGARGSSARGVTVGEQRDASEGLVGYWKMDELYWTASSSDAADSSGNDNTGIPYYDATTTSAGKFKRAGSFDGADDYVDIGSVYSSVYTIEFWLKTASTTQPIIDLDGSSYYIEASSNTINLAGDSSETIYIDGVSGSAIDNNWHFVVIVPSAAINASDVDFGRVGSDNFTGTLDDIKFYSAIRNVNQIKLDYEQPPPPAAHWKFDEKTGDTTYDTSGSNDGDMAGSGGACPGADNCPIWTSGKYGSALEFDGVDDYVDVSSLSFDTNSFSISLWTKNPRIGSGSYGMFFGSVENDYNDEIIRLYVVDDGTLRAINDYGVSITYAPADFDGWHHIAYVYNDKNVSYLYWDGVRVNQDSAFSAITAEPVFSSIGIGYGSGYPLNGVIDDVRFYNYARSYKQVLEDMNAGHPAVGSPVGSYVAYWSFDESYDVTAYDKSIHKNNLTASNQVSWEADCHIGSCFNGTSTNYLSRADDTDFDVLEADDYSITGWFKHNTISAIDYIVVKNNGAGYKVYMDADGDIVFGIDDDAVWTPDDIVGDDQSKNYDDNNWHHFAAVKNATTSIYIYVDGVEIDSDTSIVIDDTLANADPLYIGVDDDGSSNGWEGQLDEIQIYRFALSPAEIKQLYNDGVTLSLGAKSTESDGAAPSNAASREYCVPGDTSTCLPPVAQWSFEEKTGQTAYDTSTSTNDGALGSGAGSDSADPTWKSSQYCHSGACLEFDGIDDYLDVSDFGF